MKKVKITITSEEDNGVTGTAQFDTNTYRYSLTGEVYPWVLKALMKMVEENKDHIGKPVVEQK